LQVATNEAGSNGMSKLRIFGAVLYVLVNNCGNFSSIGIFHIWNYASAALGYPWPSLH
jgi:hypothetical protein